MATEAERPPRVLLAVARFYPDIADALAAGARAVLEAAGAEVDEVGVPGAFELPAAIAFASGPRDYNGNFYPGNARLSLSGDSLSGDYDGELYRTGASGFSFEESGAGAYDGYIALGCVIRGETTHYDYVCRESAHGLAWLSIERRLAIGYGVLTTENREQAWARAAPDRGDKGGAAARACLAMMALRKRFDGAK